jgi:FixJ family two-component response regulator
MLASNLKRVSLVYGFEMNAQSANAANSHPMIFVVDDEPMLLDLAAAILQPLGFEVRIFRDPQVALAEFPKAKPAVLVTDYAMGAMNGMDLVRECKRISPNQKILLLSGTVDERIYADATAKPDTFLAKPYQVRDFIESVQRLAAR